MNLEDDFDLDSIFSSEERGDHSDFFPVITDEDPDGSYNFV